MADRSVFEHEAWCPAGEGQECRFDPSFVMPSSASMDEAEVELSDGDGVLVAPRCWAVSRAIEIDGGGR